MKNALSIYNYKPFATDLFSDTFSKIFDICIGISTLREIYFIWD
jgi:hypothetical protein